MGRTLGRIIGVVTAPISLIDRDLGNLVRSVAFTAIGTSLGGPLGAAIGGTLAGGIAALDRPPPTPTPASSTAIKTSRPPRVGAYGESRLYGAYFLYETGNNGAAIDGYAVHDGPMTSPVAFYLGDDTVTHKSGVSYPGGLINSLSDGRYGDDTTRFYWTDGRTPGTTIPVIIDDLPGVWTSNHRGDGVCLIYTRFASVKSKNFLKRYPSGVPTASIAAKWQKCPDPWAADPCDHSAWTWTENPIRQLMHYMLYREAPKPTIPVTDPAYAAELMALRVAFYNRKIAPSLASWRTASDVCDEAVSLKAGGTEARYRSCLSHSLVAPHGETKAGLLQLCDGWMATQADGSVAVHAGKFQTPTVSIGPEHIVAYDWQGVGVDDDSAVNEIVCSYVSKAHEYNSVECDAWRDEDDIAERGALLSETLDLQTPSWGQVRRLAKRRMARANTLYRGTVTTNVAGRIARSQRYINLRIEEAGTIFFDGVAEITAITRNVATGGVTFTWVAANANIDAWNPATEEGEPAAEGDRVAPAPLATPIIASAEAEIGDAGSGARIRITVDGFDRSDITWYARWRVTTDGGSWLEQAYSDIDPGPSAQLLTTGVPINVGIDVEVAYGVGDGRISDWSPLVSVSTSIADLAPPAPSLLTLVSTTPSSATVSARAPTSANFEYLVFFASATNDFGTAVAISDHLVDSPGAVRQITETGLAAGPRYYWAVAYSGNDVASVPEGPLSVSVGAFDFSAGTLTTGATLTRASAGSYRNSSGAWTSAGADTARFTYRYAGSTWQLGGLLVEPAATNGLLYSQDLTNAAWQKTGATTTAGRLTEDSSTGSHHVNQAVSYTSGSTYCLSVEAGEVTGSPKRYLTLLLAASAFGGANRYAKFDLATGAVVYTVGGATAGIEAAGPGKWRCWISATATATVSAGLQVRLHNTADSALSNYTGASGAIDATDMQLEVGSKPTSRIATTSASASRSADVVMLDWASRSVPNGTISLRYTFDDDTTQTVSTTVAGGTSTVPTNLNRSTIKRIDKL